MNKNLTKRDIVLKVADKTKLNQADVLKVIQLTIDEISNNLISGMNVELRGFGSFTLEKRKKRVGRNPRKPDVSIVIPNRQVIKFKAGKYLKAKAHKNYAS